MKLGFTGGGSGGHFYPIIAVVQQVQELIRKEKLLDPELIYFAPSRYDAQALFDHGITFVRVSAGKLRRYFSLRNFFDIFKTAWGMLWSLWQVLMLYPDVIFSTGSYASFPVLFAARILRIPVIIHESDALPGRSNAWAARFAVKVGTSFPEALEPFEKIIKKRRHAPENVLAATGHPVRKELLLPVESGAREYLHLEHAVPVLFVLGGSQGAQLLNETLIDTLPGLLERYQVIHQTGTAHLKEIAGLAETYLEQSPFRERYKPFDFLNTLALRMAAGAADLVISRAGAGAIFEIAAWGKPSIIVPIGEGVSHNQRENAFAYARAGATDVIEEDNLTPHLLVSEIDRLMRDTDRRVAMARAARAFTKPDAAEKVAREILELALKHER